MPAITIRDVSPETRDELAARAARSGRSLQEYLRRELEQLASRPTNEDVLERIRVRRAQLGGTGISVAQILEGVDADRR